MSLGNWDVYDAVERAVYGDPADAVFAAVNRAVNWAVDWTVERAFQEDPPHSFLQDYLGKSDENGQQDRVADIRGPE